MTTEEKIDFAVGVIFDCCDDADVILRMANKARWLALEEHRDAQATSSFGMAQVFTASGHYWDQLADKLISRLKKELTPTEPMFLHDCMTCKFLGPFKHDGTYYDLYYCPSVRPTVIARHSDDGPDYYSGLDIAASVPALKEARRRAQEKGWLV